LLLDGNVGGNVTLSIDPTSVGLAKLPLASDNCINNSLGAAMAGGAYGGVVTFIKNTEPAQKEVSALKLLLTLVIGAQLLTLIISGKEDRPIHSEVAVTYKLTAPPAKEVSQVTIQAVSTPAKPCTTPA
jgi:hypothetical protein